MGNRCKSVYYYDDDGDDGDDGDGDDNDEYKLPELENFTCIIICLHVNYCFNACIFADIFHLSHQMFGFEGDSQKCLLILKYAMCSL